MAFEPDIAAGRRVCIVVVGSTGLGKSSLIKAMTGSDVSTSAGARSDTKETRIIDDTKNGRIFLDTMGAEDSEEKESDESILRKVLHSIQKQGIVNASIKLLWVVKKETRATSSLKIQARFIQSFVQESSPWDSVIVLVKEGENFDDENEPADCQGALAAAAEFGARIASNAAEDGEPLANLTHFGFTCLDWLPDGKRSQKKRRQAESTEYESRFEEGLLFEHEITQHVNDLLSQRVAIDVTFRMQKCENCGVEGDERCVPLECHDRPVMVHPKIKKLIHLLPEPVYIHPFGLQYFHEGVLTSFHPGSCENHSGSPSYSHAGNVVYIHDGKSRGKHRGTLVYFHTGGIDYYHAGTLRDEQIQTGNNLHPGVVGESGSISIRICRPLSAGTDDDSHHLHLERVRVRSVRGGDLVLLYANASYLMRSHPDPNHHPRSCLDATSKICHNAHGDGFGYGFEDHWMEFNCAGITNVSEIRSIVVENGNGTCKYRIVGARVDVKVSGRTVHAFKFETLQDTYEFTMPSFRYSCCGRDSFSTGCTPEYETVQKHICCGGLQGSNGCQTRMSCCNNHPSSQGCNAVYSCCGNVEPCEERYSCCDNLIGSDGCRAKMSCCDNYVGGRGCQKIFSCCNRAAGELCARYSCCDKPESADGCQQKYSCCGNGEGSQGCAGIYSCCNKPDSSDPCQGKFECCGQAATENGPGGERVALNVRGCVYACCHGAVGSPECEKQCQRCRGKWGESEGCTIRQESTVDGKFHVM